jgi:hypothetical protein
MRAERKRVKLKRILRVPLNLRMRKATMTKMKRTIVILRLLHLLILHLLHTMKRLFTVKQWTRMKKLRVFKVMLD